MTVNALKTSVARAVRQVCLEDMGSQDTGGAVNYTDPFDLTEDRFRRIAELVGGELRLREGFPRRKICTVKQAIDALVAVERTATPAYAYTTCRVN
ncbi:MAG: hypothetical protein V1489_00060 [Candidatus Liptonbacteria bacterium]